MALLAALMLPGAAAQAQPAADTAAIWTLQDENSSIGATNPTDRFYVNGLRLGWMSPTTKVPDFLDTVAGSLWGDGQRRIGFNLSQQIYTPADTSLVIPNPRDRPYAGLLLGNFSLLSDTADSRSVLTLSLGVVGPASGAEQVQNGFHDLIGQGHPKGWNSQIQNVPAFEVLHERTWRLPLTTIGRFETDVLPSLTAGVGDVRVYLQTGAALRFGQGLESDFGVPRVRPGLSGNDAFTPTRPLAWYVFAGVDGQAVAYDILLENSPFRGGPHVSTIWDVAEFQGGFAIMAHGMRLSFSYVAQTPEFHGQIGGMHQFGSAAISIRF
nr:lipid A deacylase LpxR family protein [uncultured Rhodopila sp.]